MTRRHRWISAFVAAARSACLPGSVPPPQSLFVCQATKLIEIKAGSCWLGIIKSLTNTNNAASRGAGRVGLPRPVGLCTRAISDGFV